MSTETSINSRLPEGCYLAYVISHEAFYSKVIDGREINICAEARDGGVAWEFQAKEVHFGNETVVKLGIFDDAFAAFTQVPELFEAIGSSGRIRRLEDLVTVLDRVGAQDITARVAPERLS